MTVEQLSPRAGGAEEALEDALGRERRRQRQQAAGHALREPHQVGRHVFVLTREHATRAAKADRDLVGDQQRAVPVAERAHSAEPARRQGEHAGGRLHARLDDDRSDLVAGPLEQPLQGLQAVNVAGGVLEAVRTAVAVGVLGSQHREDERSEQPVERLDPAECDRSQRIAVVRALERDEARAPAGRGVLVLGPELERHLERDLHGGSAVVAEEDAGESRRGDPDQPLRQLDRRHAREPEQRGVRQAVELLVYGCPELRVIVPVHVHPHRGDPVEVAVALRVDQVVALAALDHQRPAVEPLVHLGERVPQVATIPLDPVLHVCAPTSRARSSPKVVATHSISADVWLDIGVNRRRAPSRGTDG